MKSAMKGETKAEAKQETLTLEQSSLSLSPKENEQQNGGQKRAPGSRGTRIIREAPESPTAPRGGFCKRLMERIGGWSSCFSR